MELSYLDQAQEDLILIKRFIARESGSREIALRYTAKIREHCRKMAEQPAKVGRTRPELGEDLRSFPYGNYVIFFRYVGDNLEVITIIEGHRDIEALFEGGT